MTGAALAIHGFVDPAWAIDDASRWNRARAVARALGDAGARYVPWKLSGDWTSFVPLLPDEMRTFSDDAGDADRSGRVFLSLELADREPPLRKTIDKIAAAHGWRVIAAPELALGAPDGVAWAKAVVAQARADVRDAGARSRWPTPLLSISVTTYNRAAWLAHSLPLILQQAAPYGDDLVEVLVCDNASSDDTREVVAVLREKYRFVYHRNEKNVGMLGNLGVSCDEARGRYIWVIGDDDLMVEGTVARILAAIAKHPSIELIYTNYAFTRFDRPSDLVDAAQVIRAAKVISPEIRDQFAERVSDIATKSENCFTAIYCLIYREDHARRAYHQDVSGPPFSSLSTSVPSADYVCRHMFDRPGYWVGDPCVVVNMNVSWMRYASLYILERFPELFDLMQEKGVDAARIDKLRARHVGNMPGWFREIHLGKHRDNLPFFSVERMVRRFGHLPAFRERWPELRKIYREAFRRGLAHDSSLAPEHLETILSKLAPGRSM